MAFPSREQRAVISHRGEPLLVVAGPGTGKTRTLIERMIEIVAEDQSREVSFVTFTRASRGDVRTKLESALGGGILEEAQAMCPKAATLHAYAKSVVHRYARIVGRRSDFSVLMEGQGEEDVVVEEVLQDLGLDEDADRLSESLTCFRCTGAWPQDCELRLAEQKRVAEYYERLLRFYNTFDIEGLVVTAGIILADGADALPPLYLHVDEYQDLNPMDQKLVQLAASHPLSQVVVVADDAQSIYGFRHANLEGVRELWRAAGWRHVLFDESYRLPSHILNAAQALIADEGYLGALTPRPDDGRRILTLQCTTSDLQIEAVARQIHCLRSAGEEGGREPLAWNAFLVLCPTARHVTRTADTLSACFDVPTHEPRRESIDDDLWKLGLALRMLHRQDSLALRQWLPLVGLNREEITDIRQQAMATTHDLYTYGAVLEDPRIVRIYSAIERLRSGLGDLASFEGALREFPGLPVREDVLRFVSGLEVDEGQCLSAGSLLGALYQEFGVTDAGDDTAGEDSVLVTTWHSAKGLEADFVFCTWLTHRFMPLPGRDAGEERRVLYVALTRARRDVILAFHELFDSGNGRRVYEAAMSPFLHEIRDHLRIDRIKAADLR